MAKVIKITRALGITIIIVTYALLVHHANKSAHPSALGAVLALIPLFIIVITYAWNTKLRVVGIFSLLIFFSISWFTWTFIKLHTGLIFWMLDVGLMVTLLLTFGQTLLSGRKPLCVHFAEIINRGTLPPEHENYARKVTVAWVVFFALIITTSTLLFFLAPLPIWSFFVNLLTLPLVLLMFIAEFIIRKRLLTDLPTGNVFDALHAYLDKSAHAR